MIIKELYISRYGSLCDRSFVFSENLNVLMGENEAGKSTLMSFVSFMLYGPDETSMRYIRASVGECGGRMTVSSVKGEFLVERKITSSESSKKVLERFTLYSLPSMKEMDVKGQPGDLILGVSKAFFMGTSFVSQRGASQYDPEKTSAAVQNILLSANEKIDTNKALKRIDEVRKYFVYKRGRGGAIADSEDKLSSLENERFMSEQARSELERTDGELSSLKARRDENIQLSNALKTEREARRAKHRREMLSERDSLSQKLEYETKALEEARKYTEENGAELMLTKIRELDVAEKYASACLADAENDIFLVEKALSEAKTSDGHKYSEEKEAALLSFHSDSHEQIKKLKSKAAFSFVLGVLCAALAVTTLLMSKAWLAIVMLGAMTGALVLAFVSLDREKKAQASLEERLAALGLDSSASLRDISDVFHAARDRGRVYAELEEKKKERTERFTRLQKEVENHRAELEKLLSINKMDDPSLPADARMASAEAFFSEMISRPRLLTERCKSIKEQITLLDRQLASLGASDESVAEPSPAFASFDDDILTRKAEQLTVEREAITSQLSDMESQRAKLLSGIKPMEDLDRLIAETRDELTKRNAQREIVTLADEAIRYASENLRSSVTPNLIAVGDRLFSEITQDKYDRIGVDEALSPNGIGKESILSVDALSYGTNEAMYIAFRLSLLLVLCREELPIMLLDESFAHIDDKRTKSTLRVLRESGIQSLVFTCSERETVLAESAEIIRL